MQTLSIFQDRHSAIVILLPLLSGFLSPLFPLSLRAYGNTTTHFDRKSLSLQLRPDSSVKETIQIGKSGTLSALDKAAVAAGGELFQSGCGSCHGSKGQGGRGPKLADNSRVREKSDKKIFDIIKLGVPGSVMPPSSAR